MKNSVSLVSLVVLAALSGCGKSNDNPSVNEDGTCTKAYVDSAEAVRLAHNEAAAAAGRKDADGVVQGLEKTKAACDAFLATHGGTTTCKATINGVDGTASTDVIRQHCKEDTELLKKIKEASSKAPSADPVPTTPTDPSMPSTPSDPSTTVPSQPVPGPVTQVGDDLLMSGIDATKVSIRFLDGATATSLMQLNGKAYAINGAIVTTEDVDAHAAEIRNGAALCTVIIQNPNAKVKNGEVWTLLVQAEKSNTTDTGGQFRQWFGVTKEKSGLMCSNVTNTAFKLKDIRASFKGIAEITVKQ